MIFNLRFKYQLSMIKLNKNYRGNRALSAFIWYCTGVRGPITI